jgi:hypothetical protein
MCKELPVMPVKRNNQKKMEGQEVADPKKTKKQNKKKQRGIKVGLFQSGEWPIQKFIRQTWTQFLDLMSLKDCILT